MVPTPGYCLNPKLHIGVLIDSDETGGAKICVTRYGPEESREIPRTGVFRAGGVAGHLERSDKLVRILCGSFCKTKKMGFCQSHNSEPTPSNRVIKAALRANSMRTR